MNLFNRQSILFTLGSITLVVLSLAFIFTVSGASKNQDDAIQVAKNIQSELTHVRLGITQNIHPDSHFQPFPVDEIRHYFQQ
ncbi:MAG TPA: hypothetical protein ENK73_01905, partial [Thiomicrospira sp.]|nr:hypothetical protein [Thiomicrospira sp.]